MLALSGQVFSTEFRLCCGPLCECHLGVTLVGGPSREFDRQLCHLISTAVLKGCHEQRAGLDFQFETGKVHIGGSHTAPTRLWRKNWEGVVIK
jgi:hypothetical protein